MWIYFWDMYSGGGQKESFAHIYIEAPKDEAIIIFYNRFHHNPNRVTCTCCGEDYSISESKTLEQATGYHRGCDYEDNKYIERPSPKSYSNKYVILSEFLKSKQIKVITQDEITDQERTGEVPDQGYVWVE